MDNESKLELPNKAIDLAGLERDLARLSSQAPHLVAPMKRLFVQTWGDRDFDYDQLDDTEKTVMPRPVFERIARWAKES